MRPFQNPEASRKVLSPLTGGVTLSLSCLLRICLVFIQYLDYDFLQSLGGLSGESQPCLYRSLLGSSKVGGGGPAAWGTVLF